MEKNIVKNQESIFDMLIFDRKNMDLLGRIQLPNSSNHDEKIIGGIVGTFQNFIALTDYDAINSIKLNYLRLLFSAEDELIIIFTVDPSNKDEYYYDAFNSFRNCFLISYDAQNEQLQISREEVLITLQKISNLFEDTNLIKIDFIDEQEKNNIEGKSNQYLMDLFTDIFSTHEKMFKRFR